MLKHFGPEKVTAIVHTVAYANFHYRILLGIGAKGEPPIAPPLAMKFDVDAAKLTAPVRPSWDDLKSVAADGLSVRLEWSKADSDELTRHAGEAEGTHAPHSITGQGSDRKLHAAQRGVLPGAASSGTKSEAVLPARDDASMVRVSLRLLRGVEAGPRVHELHVLGGDANQRLLLLNGP